MSTTPKNPWEAIAQPMQTMWANAMQQMGQPMPFGMPGAMPMTDMMGTFAKMVPTVPGAPQVSFEGSDRAVDAGHGASEHCHRPPLRQ